MHAYTHHQVFYMYEIVYVMTSVKLGDVEFFVDILCVTET